MLVVLEKEQVFPTCGFIPSNTSNIANKCQGSYVRSSKSVYRVKNFLTSFIYIEGDGKKGLTRSGA